MSYVKKPIVVEAFQMTTKTVLSEWPVWLSLRLREEEDDARPGELWQGTDGNFRISTLEGCQLVSWDDYIIQGVQGEIYPRKPDIFEATYDEVDEP